MSFTVQKLQNGLVKYGAAGLVRQFFRHKSPVYTSYVFQKSGASLINNLHNLSGFTVEVYPDYISIPSNYLYDLLVKSSGQMDFSSEMVRRFSKKCELWLGYVDGNVAGICWSKSRARRYDYFIPLAEDESVITSCFVFPENRGKGIFPCMLESICRNLSIDKNIRNVYIDCKSWNYQSVRGIEKAGFTFIGKSIRLIIRGRIFILRNCCKKIANI
ncbi:GNAT family protein [Desulfobulbus alkaliphilus]|uniref:GNAT family protein n=1 Tax=Desulfobulbus alkaliphilus TaxID=869814 RepID=UPI001962DFC0|nr:GNAT family protein [Desulfobulbus alkaliphilus]MBM9538451.1 GNAT family N-acetyltransferase [Desulfobulbus alkaliphilus]